ncbi:hypothetical protein OROHE_021398 [Orobanche hederae]
MNWTRGAILGKGGFAFVSIAKTNSESVIHHHLPPLVAVKSAKLSESESLLVQEEFLDKFQGCLSIVRCFGDDITTENGEKLYNILLEYASGGCVADRIIPKKESRRQLSAVTRNPFSWPSVIFTNWAMFTADQKTKMVHKFDHIGICSP